MAARRTEPRPARQSAVTPAEMEDNELLRTLPWRYRQWNQSSVVRWQVKAGQELCQLGDYGSTAFLLQPGGSACGCPSRGPDGQLLADWDQGEPTDVNDARDLILGEMTILSHYPRAATVRALDDGEVFEIRRNVLLYPAAQPRAPARSSTASIAAGRSTTTCAQVPLFAELSEADRAAVPGNPPPRATAVRQTAVGRAGAGRAGADDLPPGGAGRLLLHDPHRPREGVADVRRGRARRSTTCGPTSSFGEIACLGDWARGPVGHSARLRGPLDSRRTTSCSALDDVELVRIDAAVFREPAGRRCKPLREPASIQQAQRATWPASNKRSRPPPAAQSPARSCSEFTDQGLYNAQRLLVLDLEACTRCDECTKACSDTHDGVTRLIREGLRIDKWLVASSCRSCSDPYCLVGCPVDAIHRIDPSSTRKPPIHLQAGRATPTSSGWRFRSRRTASAAACARAIAPTATSTCTHRDDRSHDRAGRAAIPRHDVRPVRRHRRQQLAAGELRLRLPARSGPSHEGR